jgi:hypothetical protein
MFHICSYGKRRHDGGWARSRAGGLLVVQGCARRRGERKLLGCGRSEDLERHPTSHMRAAEQLWEGATRRTQQAAPILIACPL